MQNIIVVVILLILVGVAAFNIWKGKKKGTGCIGCSSAGCCSKECSTDKKRIFEKLSKK